MAFPTTNILDNFNRANENPMTGWTNLYNSFQVTSNQAAGTNASANLAIWNASSYGSDTEAFVTIATKPGNGDSVAVYARLKDIGSIATIDGYLVALTVQSGTDTVAIQRIDNGVGTTLGSTINQEFNAGDKLGISVIGSTITAWRYDGSTWTNLGSQTDSTYPAAGSLGMTIYGTTGRLDDFGGGTYVPPPPPGSDTSWTIAIDWDRNGTFSSQYDDVTARVISANWSLGVEKPYVDITENSMLQLVLSNEDKRYSPENAASPLYGLLKPFRQVRIQSNDGTTVRTYWTGWIEQIQPDVGQRGKRTIKITATGPTQFYKAAESKLPLQEDKFTDEVLVELIKEVVFPPGIIGAWILGRAGNSEMGNNTYLNGVTAISNLPSRDPDNSLVINVAGEEGKIRFGLVADNWVIQGGAADEEQRAFNVYKAIGDIVSAEHGKFLFSRDGKALFWNRHHLLLDPGSSVATFNNTMTDMAYTYAGIEQTKNEVIVVCHPRTVSSITTDVLWQLGNKSTIQVNPGETKTLFANYQDDSKNRVGGKDVTVTGVEFQSGLATITVDPRANGAELKLVNNGTVAAVVSKCIIQGTKITDSGEVEAKSINQSSIDEFGRRTLRINLPSIDSLEQAQYIADFECNRRSTPRGEVTALTVLSHGVKGGNGSDPTNAMHIQQLARTLGDLIEVQEAQTAHGKKHYIVGEAHELTQGAAMWKTTWYLEPAKVDHYPWKLGVTGRSELGQNTYLTY